MRPRRWLVSAALAVALCAPAARPALAQSPADTDAARSLFREGSTLAQQGKWDEAREKFERSLKLKRASLTLYSLGVAQRQTGKLLDARESFIAFLAEPISPATQPFEKPAREAIVEIDKRVARLMIVVTPEGAPDLAVEVDGAAVPSTTLDQPRMLDPGAHAVTAVARGYKKASTVTSPREGELVTVRLSLEATPEPTPPPVQSKPVEPKPDRALPLVLIGGGVATFAAGAATGLGAWVDASSAPTADGPEADRARSKALIGDVIGGIGIAAVAVGVALWIVQSNATPAAQTSGPGPVSVWSRGDAAGVQLRF